MTRACARVGVRFGFGRRDRGFRLSDNELLRSLRGGPAQLERLNQEIKRRTDVIRIFPNEESALRLIRALAVEIHEDWIEAHRYLNMETLREQRKQLQLLEAA